jgi:hypothetical protein
MPTTPPLVGSIRLRGGIGLLLLLAIPVTGFTQQTDSTAPPASPVDSLALDSVAPGTRVRLGTAEHPSLRVGVVTRHFGDTLLVETRDTRELVRASPVDLLELDVPNGTRRSANRIVIGLVLGAAAGWVLGDQLDALAQPGTAECDAGGLPKCPRHGIGIGIAIGTLTGVAIGARKSATNWRPVAFR